MLRAVEARMCLPRARQPTNAAANIWSQRAVAASTIEARRSRAKINRRRRLTPQREALRLPDRAAVRSAVAVRSVYLVQAQESFDELGDLALLVAGQLAGFRKNLTQLANGSAALSLGGLAEEILRRDVEGLGKLFNLLGLEGNGMAFPCGIGVLSDTHFFGNLGLGKTRCFAGGV